jgi:hypothetical protein
VAGRPISIEFDVASSTFTLELETRPDDLESNFKDLPTEIYLPAVHYGELSQEDVEELEERFQDPEDKANSAAPNKQNVLHLPHIHFPWHRHRPRLALNVSVSRGHYEIIGHTLKWYHRTSSTAKRTDQQPRRETITIKRKGGPRPEVTAAYGEKPRSMAQVVWDTCCGMCSVA